MFKRYWNQNMQHGSENDNLVILYTLIRCICMRRGCLSTLEFQFNQNIQFCNPILLHLYRIKEYYKVNLIHMEWSSMRTRVISDFYLLQEHSLYLICSSCCWLEFLLSSWKWAWDSLQVLDHPVSGVSALSPKASFLWVSWHKAKLFHGQKPVQL